MADMSATAWQLRPLQAAAEKSRRAGMARDALLKQEANDLFKVELRALRSLTPPANHRHHAMPVHRRVDCCDHQAARFELAIKKYTEALEACSDKHGKLALTIRNNRYARTCRCPRYKSHCQC